MKPSAILIGVAVIVLCAVHEILAKIAEHIDVGMVLLAPESVTTLQSALVLFALMMLRLILFFFVPGVALYTALVTIVSLYSSSKSKRTPSGDHS